MIKVTPIRELSAAAREEALLRLNPERCSFDGLAKIIHEIPEKGLVLFKMSLRDYERAMEEHIHPLFQNSRFFPDNVTIISDYLKYRRDNDMIQFLQDVNELRNYPELKEALTRVYWPDDIPEEIMSSLF